MDCYGARRRRLMVGPCLGALAATCIAGCSGLGKNESQLFGGTSTTKSASITYRVVRDIAAREPTGPAVLQFLPGQRPGTDAERRITTVAIRYPHPAGKAGYARVECVVRKATTESASSSSSLPDWLERARKLADDSLPGLTLADGIHEAMGLDVPIAELESVLTAVRQMPASSNVQGDPRMTVRLASTIDGVAAPVRTSRVREIETLIGRVRRDGKLISHTTRIEEPMFQAVDETNVAEVQPVDVPAQPAGQPPVQTPVPQPYGSPVSATMPAAAPFGVQQMPSPVVAAGHVGPTMRRLPPVETPVELPATRAAG